MALIILTLVCVALAGAVKAEQCKRCSNRHASGYIVGGTQTDCYEFPFICSLQSEGYHLCGGSLVAYPKSNGQPDVLSFVTAAHCVHGYHPMYYQVKCGIHDRIGDNAHSQTFDVLSINVHTHYNPNNYSHDVAILYLHEQPQVHGYILPVKLASQPYTPGENAVVIGWGSTTESAYMPARCLMKVTKPLIRLDTCKHSLQVDETMLCAGYTEGGKDACQGDSGGPMVVQRGHGWELIGIVSWGYGCARPGYPGVYADVHRHREWILNNLQQH